MKTSTKLPRVILGKKVLLNLYGFLYGSHHKLSEFDFQVSNLILTECMPPLDSQQLTGILRVAQCEAPPQSVIVMVIWLACPSEKIQDLSRIGTARRVEDIKKLVD